MRILISAVCLVFVAATASAQSLFILRGERAVDLAVGWSVGPVSDGIETHASVSLGGRWDVGVGFARYLADFGGDDGTRVTEWSPGARYVLFKEADDETPVSLSLQAQYVQSRVAGGGDSWYALTGAHLSKQLTVTDGFALYPFAAMSLAAESTGLGGDVSDREWYLARQFGVHALVRVAQGTWMRLALEEQSFRRETFRAARVGLVRRF